MIDDSIDSNPEVSIQEEPKELDTREIVEQALDKVERKDEEEKPVEKAEKQESSEPKRDPWKSWKPEAAEKLRGLPEDVQKIIEERQDQFHKGIEMYKEAASFAKTIDKAISPYKDYLKQLNVSPEVAFPNLLKTEKTLRTGSPQIGRAHV